MQSGKHNAVGVQKRERFLSSLGMISWAELQFSEAFTEYSVKIT